MNIIQEVNAYLLTKITPYSTIYEEAFPSDAGEEIMSRNDPSQAAGTRYMDASRIGIAQFSYYAKSMVPDTARLQLEAIITALDFEELTPITGGTAIRLEVATTPAFVEKRESGVFIFVSSFRLEYHVGR